jgi:hypothetical protein
MKATTTLGNLIEQVETMSAGNFDETVSLSEIEFGSLNEMWVSNVSVEVLPQAQRLLANRLHTPFSYLERCPAELQAENLNYWLEQERKERESFFLRFNGQKDVRAVFTDRYTAIDNREILSKMIELNFRPEQEVQYMLDNGMMVVKVPDYGKSFNVVLTRLSAALVPLGRFTKMVAVSVPAKCTCAGYRGCVPDARIALNFTFKTLAGRPPVCG